MEDQTMGTAGADADNAKAPWSRPMLTCVMDIGTTRGGIVLNPGIEDAVYRSS